MEGLIDNAKKFMASEEGQKMQATFGMWFRAAREMAHSLDYLLSYTITEQQGGADIDEFLGKNKASSSGDNVNFQKSSGNTANYGGNQYSGDQQGSRDVAFSGDASKAQVREQDHDYSGYGGEDCESSCDSWLVSVNVDVVVQRLRKADGEPTRAAIRSRDKWVRAR